MTKNVDPKWKYRLSDQKSKLLVQNSQEYSHYYLGMKPYLLVKCYLHLYINTVRIQLVYKINVHNYSAYNRTYYIILIYTTSVFLSIYFKCISHLEIIYMLNTYDFVNLLFISLCNILHLIENFQTKLVEIYVSIFMYIYFVHV